MTTRSENGISNREVEATNPSLALLKKAKFAQLHRAIQNLKNNGKKEIKKLDALYQKRENKLKQNIIKAKKRGVIVIESADEDGIAIHRTPVENNTYAEALKTIKLAKELKKHLSDFETSARCNYNYEKYKPYSNVAEFTLKTHQAIDGFDPKSIKTLEGDFKTQIKEANLSKTSIYSRLIKEIAVAMTGLGALFLAGNALYSYARTGKVQSFLAPKSEKIIEEIEGLASKMDR